MSREMLERYVAQHIAASPDEVIRFSWHGGEPTLLGVDYFQTILQIQRRLTPAGRRIANGMQTNGVLLDAEWARFLSQEGFAVGLSLDGPQARHDQHRVTRDGQPTFPEVLRGYTLLREHGVPTDVLCVVGSHNVHHPGEVYGFLKQIGAAYVTFLPMVEPRPDMPQGVSAHSVPADAWGDFLCAIFEEWVAHDIGRVQVQLFEEAVRTAFGQEHSLCIFRPVCGDIPVVDWDGRFYACDHYVDAAHCYGNIRDTPLADLIDSRAQRAFGLAKSEHLPRYCQSCEVLAMCHGECPRNRFAFAPDGEAGLCYLCPGYKRFFHHAKPFVDAVAAEWRRQQPTTSVSL